MRNRVLRAALAVAGGLVCAVAMPSAASAIHFPSLPISHADQTVASIDGTIHFAGGPASGAGATVGDVPAPTTWAMIVMGFGTLGAALRRREEGDSLFA